MKHTKNILGAMLLTAAAVASTSCVDDTKLLFNVEKPASIAGMEYLNDYDVLKSYINSSANPDFKLGIALAANDYIADGLVTRLANSNFHEMTAGNAMKYASVVADDGSMNFDVVENFVSAAKAGGMTIYGHTLAWHAQQRNKYLNKLIAPTIIPGEPGAAGNGGYCLILHNEEVKANVWDAQVFYTFSEVLSQNVTYTLTCMAKATENCSVEVYMQGGNQGYPGSFSVGTEWEAVSFSFTPSHGETNKIALNFGKYVGQIYLDDIVITAAGLDDNLVRNGDFEEGNIDGWRSWSYNFEKVSEDGEGYSTSSGGGHCLTITNSTKKDNNWEAQVWYKLNEPLSSGVEYTFTAMGKASEPYNAAVFLQSEAAGTQEYGPALNFKQTWEEVKISFTLNGADKDKVTLNFGDFTGTLFLDNVKLVETGSIENLISNSDFEAGNIDGWNSYGGYQALSADGEGYSSSGTPEQIIEKTPEEKKEILTGAMNSWIEGMMKATGGYVTAWDVVNEAISGGGNDGEGNYTLQSANGASEEDAKNNFYWQDYLGSVDYVRIAVAAARKYYAENGGTAPLKLFVNDYNLESDWDDNKKVKSLVNWIKKWEADGVTEIDGIGTQMHVSCYANAATQKSKEDHVVKMFEIMAASGKLVKITELDMGYVDENGTSVKTENMTEAQHKAMAEYYKFIIKKYFEIIPVAQQYGITQWCATDAPSSSGWRGGEPVGLWDSNYNRKHTYAGFADGLAGK